MILTVLAVLLTVWSVSAVAAGVYYLGYIFTRTDKVDVWTVLYASEVICAVTGIVGVWVTLRHRAYVWTLLFLLVQIPIPFLIGANRCDVLPYCKTVRWATLPHSFFDWSVRVRR
ncbi:MAG TPA: hypothetical protein VGI79_06205 [Caulobacteraceae bacterium]